MSESRRLLCDMADGLFADLAEAGFDAAWPRIEEAGFASLLVSEEQGGFGGDWGDAYAVLRIAGRHALSVPLGDTIIAHRLLAEVGIVPPSGPIGLARANGKLGYGRHCGCVIFVDGGELRLIEVQASEITAGHSLAGEPFDRICLVGAPLASAPSAADLIAFGAFALVAQSAGALEAAFELTLEHVNTRVQFGKALGRFQAVQQAMAEFSVEAAAIDAAGQAMAAALDNGSALDDGAAFEIAAAKLRANIAIEKCFPIAHRLHGAIGFTMEYALNRYTRRLMDWRGDCGNDAYWAGKLGRRIAGLGGAGFWHEMARRSDITISAEPAAA
jgi:acyl-CoA dehydrogenase